MVEQQSEAVKLRSNKALSACRQQPLHIHFVHQWLAMTYFLFVQRLTINRCERGSYGSSFLSPALLYANSFELKFYSFIFNRLYFISSNIRLLLEHILHRQTLIPLLG